MDILVLALLVLGGFIVGSVWEGARRGGSVDLLARAVRAEFTVEAIDDARRRQGMAAHPARGCDEDIAAFWRIIEDAL